MTGPVLTDVSDGIGTITLNKPEKLNAWDGPMRAEVQVTLKDWNTRDDVRAIIVTGSGDRAFSAGQDLDETEKFKSGEEGGAWFRSWRSWRSIRPEMRRAPRRWSDARATRELVRLSMGGGDDDYSYRNATIGSTRVARRAGS